MLGVQRGLRMSIRGLVRTGLLGLTLVVLMSGCSEGPTTAPPTETPQSVQADSAPIQSSIPSTSTPMPTPTPPPTPTPLPTATPTLKTYAPAIPGPPLANPRYAHQGVLLEDGRVVVLGGYTDITEDKFIDNWPIYSLEFYDSEKDSWSTVEPEAHLGFLFLAVHLSSSRLLFVGFDAKEIGEQIKLSGVVNVLDLTEETWTQISSPGFLTQLPAMLLLEDGRVMVSIVSDSGDSTSPSHLDTNEFTILDPDSGKWERTSPNEFFNSQRLFLLDDGRVMSLGSVDPYAHAEVYDPAADTWTVLSSLDPFDHREYAIQLSDGRLLAIGQRSLVYDPAADVWTPVANMAQARIRATLTLLSDGRVLVAGGEDPDGIQQGQFSSTEIFDPATNSWSPGPGLSEPRSGHSATLLPDGRVMFAGGVKVEEDRYLLYSSVELIDLS